MDGPLLLTDNDALRAEVTRVIGPVGATRPGPAARSAWTAAPVVLLGLDALEPLRSAGMPRREDVLLLVSAVPSAHDWQAAVDLGVSSVLALPGDERLLVDRTVGRGLRAAGPCRLIGLVAGSGGAGASTVAAALAVVASRTTATVLVDADPYAGGLDVLLGLEEASGPRWPDLGTPQARMPVDLTAVLPGSEQLRVLSHRFGELHQPAAPLTATVSDQLRSSSSLVVIDLPRVPDPAAEVWLSAVDLAVVVVAARVRAVAAAATTCRGLSDRDVGAVLAVRDPGGAGLSVDDVARGLGLSAIGAIRSEAAVASAAEHGRPPLPLTARSRRRGHGSLDQLCVDILAGLERKAA